MKKLFALLLALAMAFSLAACGEKNTADAGESEPEGLFYQLTGLDPAATLLTVDGQEVPAEMYLYWVLYSCDYLASNYGMYFLDEEGRLKWDEEWSEGVTLKDSVLEETLNTAKMYMIVEKWADDYGITLSAEVEQSIDEELAAIAEEMGGEEAFVEYLATCGITPETNRRMSRVFYLYNRMVAMAAEEGSPFYIEDDVLYQYGVTEDAVLADHILLAYPEDESQRETVRATMEEVRRQIVEYEDPMSMFNYLADNFSEDPGRANSPNGYFVTENSTFVEAFETTALSLEEGEVSEVVESSYGYHILMRKPLRYGVAETYVGDLLAVAMENAEIVWADAYAGFDVASFYAGHQDYMAGLDAAAAGETGTAENSAAADTDAAEGTN